MVQRSVQAAQRRSHPGSFLKVTIRRSMFPLCSHVSYIATQEFSYRETWRVHE